VLERALQAFWKGGYSGTSLDALAEATGLNRPSLYAGLGDKRTIYIKAMRRFQVYACQHFGDALQARQTDRSFADVVARYLRAAIEVDGKHPERGVSGCAVISTATAEALTDPEIRQVLDDVLNEMDAQLHARLVAAVADGELPEHTDVSALCFLLTSSAHSIGIRARAGHALEQMEGQLDAIAQILVPSLPEPASADQVH